MVKEAHKYFRCDIFPKLAILKQIFLFNLLIVTKNFQAVIYLLKVNNRNARTRCEICSKLTIKTPEQRQRFTMVKVI